VNIFVLDTNPQIAAQHHCDKHVLKQSLETAQILCTVRHINKHLNTYDEDNNIPYKPTHKNHPCVLWAANHCVNYAWLLALGDHLCQEYTFRYGKKHKCQDVINNCRAAYVFFLRFPHKFNEAEYLTDITINDFYSNVHKYVTPFEQCMPDCYKVKNSPVAAYRNYYVGDKVRFAEWTKREVPYWFSKNIER